MKSITLLLLAVWLCLAAADTTLETTMSLTETSYSYSSDAAIPSGYVADYTNIKTFISSGSIYNHGGFIFRAQDGATLSMNKLVIYDSARLSVEGAGSWDFSIANGFKVQQLANLQTFSSGSSQFSSPQQNTNEGIVKLVSAGLSEYDLGYLSNNGEMLISSYQGTSSFVTNTLTNTGTIIYNCTEGCYFLAAGDITNTGSIALYGVGSTLNSFSQSTLLDNDGVICLNLTSYSQNNLAASGSGCWVLNDGSQMTIDLEGSSLTQSIVLTDINSFVQIDSITVLNTLPLNLYGIVNGALPVRTSGVLYSAIYDTITGYLVVSEDLTSSLELTFNIGLGYDAGGFSIQNNNAVRYDGSNPLPREIPDICVCADLSKWVTA